MSATRTTNSDARSRARGFAIALPPGWHSLDLDPVTSEQRIRLLASAATRNDPAKAAARDDLARGLETIAGVARQARAEIFAVYAATEGDALVSASVTAAARAADPVVVRDGGVDLDALCLQVAGRDRAFPVLDVEIVALPAGRAVKARLRPELPVDDSGQCASADTVQFILPTPGQAAVLVFSFSTPTLERADELRRRFDALAATIEWTWDSEGAGEPPPTADGDATMPLAIDLPRSFYALDRDLDTDAERSAVTRSVDDHLVRLGLPVDRDERDAFVARALVTLAAARQHGAIGFALALHPFGDRPIEAYLAIYCARGPDANKPAALDALAHSVLASNPTAVGHQDTTIVTLNGRPAVRCTGFATLDLDECSIVAVCHYWIPIPGSGTQVVVWGWTPEPEAADEIGELFDTIVAGVRIR